jgi:DNA-directed RNA polymerase subunit RPC12/RpoP
VYRVAKLVAAKCPTCGAGLRLDPGQEVVSCTYCNTSAFVKTRTRPATQQVLQRRVPVIDLSGGNATAVSIAMVAALLVAGGSFAAITSSRPARPTSTEASDKSAPQPQPVKAVPSVRTAPEVPPPPPGMKYVDVDGLKVLRPEAAAASEKKSPRGPIEVEVNGLKILRDAPAAKGKLDVPLPPRSTVPTVVSESNLSVSGGLEKSVVSSTIRQAFGRFRFCYAQALENDPSLTATSTLRFVIEADGTISNLGNMGSAMPGPMRDCVISAYRGLRFPTPTSQVRPTVLSKLSFSPG